MQQIGLALSGGGFRAVLYHLGVVRFLRDAGLLANVTHITSVSGGSVLGAHLVLNWDRYCGSDDDFDRASEELLNFLRLDVRNRIVRRFPFASAVNVARRTVRMPALRQYTRAGLLEQHYERFLYGDTGLFQLPENPRLYILATDLSEGSLCAFHRDGLLLQRRLRHRRVQFEELEIGLATVPMAVAASSAFPGFFPPLELRGWEVGAKEGEFSRHAFTDGGIYDNIGLRMFRHIQQTAFRSSVVPGVNDLIDAEAVSAALLRTSEPATSPADAALAELSKKLSEDGVDLHDLASLPDTAERNRLLMERLGQLMRSENLFREPVFQGVHLPNPNAQSLLRELSASKEKPALRDRVWLNRQFIAAALQQATGKACLQPGPDGLDCILVSDAGATFKVRADGRAGGLLRTALRSSDILMDRVNQLELESFRNTPGVLFFPITRLVQPAQDPTAPHVEIQRHAAFIRTDMDRFSNLEVSALVQHGYCVARHECRNSLLPPSQIPDDRPWDPLDSAGTYESGVAIDNRSLHDEANALSAARMLQQSASRRTIRTLLSFRDWPTYVWVPLIVLLTSILPYLLYDSNRTAVRQGYVLSAVAATSPVYREMLAMFEKGPTTSLPPMPYQEVDELEPVSLSGFEVVSDDRIYDFRAWTSDEAAGQIAPFSHIRTRVRRTEGENADALLRMQSVSEDDEIQIRMGPRSLQPRLSRLKQDDGVHRWELAVDLSRLPTGSDIVLVTEQMLPTDMASQVGGYGQFQFTIFADTGLVRIWMLMPESRQHDQFEIVGYPIGDPGSAEVVVPTSKIELPIGAIATFQLINPKHNYRYECRWKWEDPSNQ